MRSLKILLVRKYYINGICITQSGDDKRVHVFRLVTYMEVIICETCAFLEDNI
jgi:hypothetical protein